MTESEVTCWTMIRGAAEGRSRDRAEFVRRYAPVIRAYLLARWRNLRSVHLLDDALQEVLLDCFREGGALTRVRPRRAGGFRAFLFGVVRNVARRFERNQAKAGLPLDSSIDPAGDDRSPSEAFDRAWAKAIMRQAAELQESLARAAGPGAERRVELLRLRFEEGLPIREIAHLWGEDAARLHHEYARARREFRAALADVVRRHHPSSVGDLDRECSRLLACLR